MEKVGFELDGETVIGDLELPERASVADPVPALVFNAPKSIEWIGTTNHIELYDSQPHVSGAISHVASGMKEQLHEGAGK